MRAFFYPKGIHFLLPHQVRGLSCLSGQCLLIRYQGLISNFSDAFADIMLLRSNFKSNIHPALLEAAKIDGAGELRIYFKIVLPLSLPIMATIELMEGINTG